MGQGSPALLCQREGVKVMEFVTLYEIKETKHALRCDAVEYYEMRPMQALSAADWQPVADDKMIRHSVPVEEIRYSDRPSVYIAIGKELRELLEVAIRGPYQQTITEERSLKKYQQNRADALQQRIDNFRSAGLWGRLVLAITGKL
jgi:hypothetical protein